MVPLLEGEPSSPLSTLLVAADALNGIAPSARLPGPLRFLNADLTVHLQRALRGGWVGFEARAMPGAHGVGLVQAALFDADGELGRALPRGGLDW